MKYDLYAVLTEAGYTKQEHIAFDILEKEYQGLYNTVKVMAYFNPSHEVVTFHYFNGHKRPFKVKTHLSEKRAYNALRDTIKNSTYTALEV